MGKRVQVVRSAGQTVGAMAAVGNNPQGEPRRLEKDTWVVRGDLSEDGMVGPLEWNLAEGCYSPRFAPSFMKYEDMARMVAEDRFGQGDRLEDLED